MSGRPDDSAVDSERSKRFENKGCYPRQCQKEDSPFVNESRTMHQSSKMISQCTKNFHLDEILTGEKTCFFLALFWFKFALFLLFFDFNSCCFFEVKFL